MMEDLLPRRSHRSIIGIDVEYIDGAVNIIGATSPLGGLCREGLLRIHLFVTRYLEHFLNDELLLLHVSPDLPAHREAI
jgi:hypothetical protein